MTNSQIYQDRKRNVESLRASGALPDQYRSKVLSFTGSFVDNSDDASQNPRKPSYIPATASRQHSFQSPARITRRVEVVLESSCSLRRHPQQRQSSSSDVNHPRRTKHPGHTQQERAIRLYMPKNLQSRLDTLVVAIKVAIKDNDDFYTELQRGIVPLDDAGMNVHKKTAVRRRRCRSWAKCPSNGAWMLRCWRVAFAVLGFDGKPFKTDKGGELLLASYEKLGASIGFWVDCE
ncbi:hypothetical protein BDN72DRAFT_866159 [Pluteus cervinus]|uniref:Uncharacterized protein n=1 Tax=Pluteus cervinus TaxID=181527 RepID=A0ACD2ZZW8_9AGAR|nr:hypothetical protein BDN72DRAFT_866159 [Pluteus cervinus]